MFIYLVFRKGNCVYVGQSMQTLAKRRGHHFSNARKGRGNLLGAAIRKYGEKDFGFVQFLLCSSQKELDEQERNLIAELKPRYNVQSGGKKSFIPWNKGKKEARQTVIDNIKKSAKSRKRTKRGRYSEVHRQKISEPGKRVREREFRCNENGRVYKNIITCAHELNISPSSLSVLLSKKTRLKSLNGYTFSYISALKTDSN